MNLPDFRNNNGLNRLRELMGAQYIPDIKRKLIEGITINRPDEVIVDSDGTLLYKRQHVVLYIRNAKSYFDIRKKLPKYHVVNCKVVNSNRKRYHNYGKYEEGVGRPVTGEFILNMSGNPKIEKLETHKLIVCEFCLEKLELKSYINGEAEFVIEPNEFPLSDWFNAIDDGYEPLTIDIIRTDGKYYIAAWRFLSWLCRKNANWTCQNKACNIDLGTERSDRRFLHAHHIKGTRYNKLEDLIVLCIRCHSKQEGGKHSQLTTTSEYQEFIRKYGDIPQTLNQTELQNWPPTAVQKDNAFSFSQGNTTDEDIPF